MIFYSIAQPRKKEKKMQIRLFEMKGFIKNLTYLVYCEKTGKAALIDPGLAGPGGWFRYRDIYSFIRKEKLNLLYIINTHRHFDHVRGNGFFTRRTEAQVISYNRGLREDDIIEIGDVQLRVIETPGHTADGICLFGEGNLFTGDTLFAGDSGATVSRDSDRPALGASLRKLIESFPPETVVLPGHDLGRTKSTTLAREREENVNSGEYRLKSVFFRG